MKTTFNRITTEDKLILQGLLREPETKTPKVLLHIHGMGGNFYENRFLDVMTESLVGEGYSFYTINTRGHDIIADFPIVGPEERYKRIGNAYEKFEECLLDIGPAVNLLTEKGYSEIILCGHSLGAAKVAYYMARTQDPRVKKLILMSPPDMVGLAEEESNHENLLEQAKQMISENKGETLLPIKIWDWYYLSANTYIDLYTRDNPIDIFNTYDGTKISLLRDVRIPTLAFMGEKDDATILPQMKALEVIRNKTPNAPAFDIDIIEDATHSYFGKEKEMVERLLNWLKIESTRQL